LEATSLQEGHPGLSSSESHLGRNPGKLWQDMGFFYIIAPAGEYRMQFYLQGGSLQSSLLFLGEHRCALRSRAHPRRPKPRGSSKEEVHCCRGDLTCLGLLLQLHGLAMSQTVKAIIRREGIRGLYGGFWAVASTAGCPPTPPSPAG